MMLSSIDQGALGVELTGMFCSEANLSRSARPLYGGQFDRERVIGGSDERESVVELRHAPGGENLEGRVASLPCELESNLTREM